MRVSPKMTMLDEGQTKDDVAVLDDERTIEEHEYIWINAISKLLKIYRPILKS